MTLILFGDSNCEDGDGIEKPVFFQNGDFGFFRTPWKQGKFSVRMDVNY